MEKLYLVHALETIKPSLRRTPGAKESIKEESTKLGQAIEKTDSDQSAIKRSIERAEQTLQSSERTNTLKELYRTLNKAAIRKSELERKMRSLQDALKPKQENEQAFADIERVLPVLKGEMPPAAPQPTYVATRTHVYFCRIEKTLEDLACEWRVDPPSPKCADAMCRLHAWVHYMAKSCSPIYL